jgi:hypothetical protein
MVPRVLSTHVRCVRTEIDRNADTLQRTITDVGEHDPALGATGRTAEAVFPFGMPKISFESHRNSSEAKSGLRLYCLWGNTSVKGKVTGTRSNLLEQCYFQPFHHCSARPALLLLKANPNYQNPVSLISICEKPTSFIARWRFCVNVKRIVLLAKLSDLLAT